MKQVNKHNENWLQDYIEKKRSDGQFVFRPQQVIEDLGVSETALKRAADRLKQKEKLLSLNSGLLVPIPPEHREQGSPPIHWFIDTYMEVRRVDYYVGLLTAASYHGATHQAAQVFQIVASKQMKPMSIGKRRIQFVRKKSITEFPVQQMKTETGYFNISTPEVTVFDLLKFHKQAGGYHHVVTVIHELAPKLNPEELIKVLNLDHELSLIQRLGHILLALGFQKKSKALREQLKDTLLPMIPLVPVRVPQKTGHKVDNIWNVIINEDLESDL